MASCSITSVKAGNGNNSLLYNKLSNLLGQEEGMKAYLHTLNNKKLFSTLDANSEPVIVGNEWRVLGLVQNNNSLYNTVDIATPVNEQFSKLKNYSQSDLLTQLERVRKELSSVNRNFKPEIVGSTIMLVPNTQQASPFTNVTPVDIRGENLDPIIKFKKYQILEAAKRKNEIRLALKDPDINDTVIASLLKERAELKNRVIALQVGLRNVKHTGNFIDFFDSATNDIQLIENLINSGHLKDLQQAEVIVEFYKAVGDFSSKGLLNHIIFGEALYDISTDKAIVDAAWKSPFINLAIEVSKYDAEIESKKRKLLLSSVNDNKQVQRTFGTATKPLSFNEIMESTKDRDMSADFISVDADNALLGQVIHNQLEIAHEEALLGYEKYRETIDNLTPKINKLFKQLSLTGRGGISPNFKKVFAQTDEFGRETGNLISRYATTWFNVKSKFDSLFRQNQFSNNVIKDKAARFKANLNLAKNQKRWLKQNTVHLNTLLLEDVFNAPELASQAATVSQLHIMTGYSVTEMSQHKQDVVDLVGQKEYDRLVRLQINNIKIFNIEYSNRVDELTDDLNNGKITPFEFDLYAQRFRLSNNPFLLSYQYEKALLVTNNGEMVVQNWESKNIYLPSNDVKHGYYDSDFDVISNNKELLDFYEVMIDINRDLIALLPPKEQAKFKENSLLFVDKSITELLLQNTDTGETAMQKKRDDLVKILSSINQSTNYTGEINPVTGEKIKSVNTMNLSLHDAEIGKTNKTKKLKWFQDNLGNVVTSKFNNIADTRTIGIDSTKDMDYYIPDDVKRDLYSQSREEVMEKKSWDLPTVMKLFAFYSTQLHSREKILPLINLQKNYYNDIKKSTTTNTGRRESSNGAILAEGFRDTANKSMNEWYNRVVLLNGNLEDKEILGNHNYVYTSEDKKLKAKLEKIIDDEKKKSTPDVRVIDDASQQLENLKQRVRTWDGMGDMLIKFIQFKGMGWNIPSMLTNVAVGTMSNYVTAAEDRAIKLDDMVKAYRIMLTSVIKNLSFNQVAVGDALKVRTLMDRYRVLQDSTNEIQKASSNSVLTHKLGWLSPLEGQRRGEYLNQAPLMISLLMNTEIVGIDPANKAKVWDVLDNEGKLLPEYRTDENIQNWERVDLSKSSENYHMFKSTLDTLIVNTHGDYHELRGMPIKARTLGKLLMTFKTWLPRAYYVRFAAEHKNIKLGYTTKGRYRSYTPLSAAIGTATMLSLVANPFTVGGGLLVAGLSLLGGTLSHVYGGRQTANFGDELVYSTKQLLGKLLLVGSLGQLNLVKDDGSQLLNGDKFTETDLANLKANFTELAFTLNYVLLMLMIKYLTYDDDDEKDSLKRKTHNMLMNTVGQLTNDLIQYVSINGTVKMIEKSVPALKTLVDIGKVLFAVYNATQGEDVIISGENAGESKVANTLDKAFVPSFFTNYFGFSRKTSKQFEKTPYDKLFFTDEHIAKDAKKRDNAEKRLEEKKAKEAEESIFE